MQNSVQNIKMNNNNSPLISVVVPTKNEEINIERCLKSIVNQSFPKHLYEILVIDNFSTDKTLSISNKFANFVFQYGPERSVQRNIGADKALGGYLLFLDADMFIEKDLLQKCIDKININSNTIALFIPEIIYGSTFFCKIRNFERSFYNATPIDAVRFIKTDVFKRCKGYDPNLDAAEDWDLDKRLKYHGTFDIVDSYLFHNESNITLSKYLGKKSNYKKGIDAYIQKWGGEDSDIQLQLSPIKRFMLFFRGKNIFKHLRNPILSICMLLIKILIFIRYIKKQT